VELFKDIKMLRKNHKRLHRLQKSYTSIGIVHEKGFDFYRIKYTFQGIKHGYGWVYIWMRRWLSKCLHGFRREVFPIRCTNMEV